MKEAVHGDYLSQMKRWHGGKLIPNPDERRSLVVGVDKNNIGEAVAQRLLDDGHNVIHPPRRELDVTSVTECEDAFFRYEPDTLVLANGETHMDWIEDYPVEEMRNVVDDSLVGSMIATREFVRATINEPVHKHIVYIGSMAHRGVLNASAPYCAAKAGLNHFAHCMGWELTPKGYSVFVVHPSNTLGTPMTEKTIKLIQHYRGLGRDEAEAYWSSINLKDRWLRPEDVADTVSHLVSGRAPYQTGTAIELSGGQR